MNNIIASLLLPILLCQSVIATQKKYRDCKPKKNYMSGERICAEQRKQIDRSLKKYRDYNQKKNDMSGERICSAGRKQIDGSFCQMLSRLNLCKARSQLPGARLTMSKNKLRLLFRGKNVGRFTFSQCSPEGRLLIMMIYFPEDVKDWSEMKVLHEAIGSASEDDVRSVVQNINDELEDPNISVRWAILPERPE